MYKIGFRPLFYFPDKTTRFFFNSRISPTWELKGWVVQLANVSELSMLVRSPLLLLMLLLCLASSSARLANINSTFIVLISRQTGLRKSLVGSGIKFSASTNSLKSCIMGATWGTSIRKKGVPRVGQQQTRPSICQRGGFLVIFRALSFPDQPVRGSR